MYRSAFVSHKYGYGLSSASILVLECLAVILILNILFRDRDAAKAHRERRLQR